MAVEVKVVVAAVVAKGGAAAEKVVVPLVVAKVAPVAAEKVTVRLVGGRVQPATLLAAAEAMLRPKRNLVRAGMQACRRAGGGPAAWPGTTTASFSTAPSGSTTSTVALAGTGRMGSSSLA